MSPSHDLAQEPWRSATTVCPLAAGVSSCGHFDFSPSKTPYETRQSWIRPQPLWFITVWRCFCVWLRRWLTFHTRCRERWQLNQYLHWWCWRENFSQKPNPKAGSAWTLCFQPESYRAAGDWSGSTFLHSSAVRNILPQNKWAAITCFPNPFFQ